MAFVALDVNSYELQLGWLKAEPCQPCAHLEHAVMAHHLGRKQGADEIPRIAVIAVIKDESAIDQTLTKIEAQTGCGALLDDHYEIAHQLSVGSRKQFIANVARQCRATDVADLRLQRPLDQPQEWRQGPV